MKKSLYHKSQAKDSCGVALIAQQSGQPSRFIVESALEIIQNLEHRGGVGSDPLLGDGAGILTQIPHALFAKSLNFSLPELGGYGVSMVFLPQDAKVQQIIYDLRDNTLQDLGFKLLGTRAVPTDPSCLSKNWLHTQPKIEQWFIAKPEAETQPMFEARLYQFKRMLENRLLAQALPTEDFHVASNSSMNLVYKGMFLAFQLGLYYKDLQDADFISAGAIVHQRYSTNTYPSWSLAQPFSMVAHNGEINTYGGNYNWAKARETDLQSNVFGTALQDIFPIIPVGLSDSGGFNSHFEFLVHNGFSPQKALIAMMPEAWEHDPKVSSSLRAFYEYHAFMLEPWDGPAAMMFFSGQRIGGALDRNGLRPMRYLKTSEGLVVAGSETGMLNLATEKIVERGRVAPGEIFYVDFDTQQISHNQATKAQVAKQKPYAKFLDEYKIHFEPCDFEIKPSEPEPLLAQQKVFAYTTEDLQLLLPPMANAAYEATMAMGTDTPSAVLSKHSQLLYHYFKQRFAQVTCPSIDSIREESVMSLRSYISQGLNLLDTSLLKKPLLEIQQPILNPAEVESLKTEQYPFVCTSLDICYPPENQSLETAVDNLSQQAIDAAKAGAVLLVLSDTEVSAQKMPIPALLATSAVHQALIRANLRSRLGLVVYSAEVRETHHFATLLGFGASAVCPYLALQTVVSMQQSGVLAPNISAEQAVKNYIEAIQRGLKKIFAKMGIATLRSYQGAHTFEIVGLDPQVIEKYFPSTAYSIGGVNLVDLEKELKFRHQKAYSPIQQQILTPLVGSEYHWRQQGEYHAYDPETVYLLQQAAWKNDPEIYQKFTEQVNNRRRGLHSLRSLFKLDTALPAVPLDQVETAEEIVKRFTTGAMSLGSISREAHETLAIAMNRLGGRSNTGEGGEDAVRFKVDQDGNLRNSRIKQVASGRFGVTSHYLVNADELQIKIAQGAKPGEGGQLPGFKVDPYIAKLRHTKPGVTLISPPPHHDIYSIEDLAQLVFDLKNANPKANVSVKLASSYGVGTVAAGVCKAKADLVVIAGHDGGTGASPASSIKHVGTPWEIGLAETQQALVSNGLRSRIRVQVDGQLKTGLDVIFGALLGAEEFGFSTSVLIATGCIMMRKCHLNTCPVGIATQDLRLRKKYHGKPEYVQNYLMFIANEVRQWMAKLGYRTFNEMVGQVHRIQIDQALQVYKTQGLDLSPLFAQPDNQQDSYYNSVRQTHGLEQVLDQQFIKQCMPALNNQQPVRLQFQVKNSDRAVGTLLGSEVSKRYGVQGLAEKCIHIELAGSAGQSLGAFLPSGIFLDLKGDANDYVGKGLCGGILSVAPPENALYKAAENTIAGNTVLYGATSGKAFFAGLVGERFAVRNSGALAVVEGIGDHGCEYMTGGTVVVLGPTGRNFAAGMSGGEAYIYDPQKQLNHMCNLQLVDLHKTWPKQTTEQLKTLLKEHQQHTGSMLAKNILGKFEQQLQHFVLVLPKQQASKAA